MKWPLWQQIYNYYTKVQILWEGNKIWKNLPLVLTKQLFLLNSVKISGRFFRIFYGLFRKAGLYLFFFTFVVKLALIQFFLVWYSWLHKWTKSSKNNFRHGRNSKLYHRPGNGNDWTMPPGLSPDFSKFTSRKSLFLFKLFSIMIEAVHKRCRYFGGKGQKLVKIADMREGLSKIRKNCQRPLWMVGPIYYCEKGE